MPAAVPLRLDPHRARARELRRLANALLGAASETIALVGREPVEAVHEARKRLKELRALLRIVEDPGAPLLRRRLRDAGRILSPARDADAVRETFQRLGALWGIEPEALSMRSPDAQERREAAMRVLEVLEDARPALEDLAFDGHVVVAGVARGYRAARRAMQRALASGLPIDFHEWRKRVKDHWYHAKMTSGFLPLMESRESAMRDLARSLGDHHDLIVFSAVAPESVVDLLATTVHHLEKQAEALGREMFRLPARTWRTFAELQVGSSAVRLVALS